MDGARCQETRCLFRVEPWCPRGRCTIFAGVSDLLKDLEGALGDRYRVQRELGRGGKAIVYLADDLKHHRLNLAGSARRRLCCGVPRGRLKESRCQ